MQRAGSSQNPRQVATHRGVLAAASLAVALVIVFASFAPAATFLVDTEATDADVAPGDGTCATFAGACSLRAAVDEANALPGPDTVELPAGHYVGGLELTESLALIGAGEGATSVTGVPADAVLRLRSFGNAVELVASSLTVAGGATGIDVLQDACCALTLDGVTVRDSTGPGIATSDAPTFGSRLTVVGNGASGMRVGFGSRTDLQDCVVRDNESVDHGGGIFSASGRVDLERCEISGNVAALDGGGIFHFFDGSITLVDSTVSGNAAGGSGGGLFNDSDLVSFVVQHSTVAFNSAEEESGGLGGIALFIENSILAENVGKDGLPDDCARADLVLGGYNLFGTLGPACVTVGDETGNVVGVDPRLGPLAPNGGQTRTHALLPDSPARDAGNPLCTEATDQRGVARPAFGRCDIGAYELACGDGIVDPGEECDDGNLSDGDCCSSTCTVESGTCDDGNACTHDDRCEAGVCQAGGATSCGACETCDATTGGCVARPLPSCRQPAIAGKGTLLLKDRTPDSRDLLIWKWLRGEATSQEDLGNPLVSDDYTLCIYDESGPAPNLLLASVAPAGGTCAGRDCWKATQDRVGFRDPDHTPDGIELIEPRSGPDGKAKVLVKAKRDNLAMPTLPLPLPLRVQLQAGTGTCWEATFSSTGVKKNDAAQFRGLAD